MMNMFGRRYDEIIVLKICNDELRRLHKLMDREYLDFDMTKTELMDRIVKLQDTVNEGVRKFCGLEY